MLQKEELKRYDRHLILPEIGFEGQTKLKNAKVLVVGAGGLGCPVLQYLAAAGVGTLGILDFDVVEESNLQRQILFGMPDLGRKKAEVAAEKLALLNPFIQLQVFTERLQTENAEGMLSGFDLIIDGSDNFPTRYLVNDVCVALGKPLVFGSVFKFEGQVAVFNFRGGPTYRCLYPEPAAAEEMPNCSEIGVLGVLPGIIGLYMANEAIKLICGIGQTLSGKLLVFNALENTTNIFSVNRSDFASKTEALPLPAQVCATATAAPEISFAELQTWISENKAVYLIDVREPYEFELQNIGGRNIPLAELPDLLPTFPEESTVVFCCQTGQRSKLAVKILTSSLYKGPVVHLKAGIEGVKKLEDVKPA